MSRRGYSSTPLAPLLFAIPALALLTLLLTTAGLSMGRAYLVAISVVTFVFYGYDKHRSQAGGSRIPEVVLHLLALVGGTVGALLGQLVFSHKIRKRDFRRIFFLIVAVQIILLAIFRWVV